MRFWRSVARAYRAWDLCTEPLAAPYGEEPASTIRAAELRWQAWLHGTCKQIGAERPLTIDNYAGKTAIKATEPFSDIISFHPYYIWNDPGADKKQFEAFPDDCVAHGAAKGQGAPGERNSLGCSR